ncbi:MAG TPA: MiaB/RimO family radical SAM methylthiotransferase [Gemmatimonadaceae bacterium]|nr:MiaB/RimO family radical SAM methylthiotransferase [Gemmatimonadaceae bacterium]
MAGGEGGVGVNVYLRTFGCRANHYDTEAVRAMVEAGGHAVVASPSDADVAVFNSCAVTSEAEAELRKVVRHVARERPALRSIVMGCAAALEHARPAALRLASLPTVDRVVAGADLPELASALELSPTTMPLMTRIQSGTRALLRIQDGCDEHCTFCATTLARGANRSRPEGELVEEALALAEHHPEIVITGIHIGTYGADIRSSLGELMQRLVRDVSGARFRLSSVEATEIDDALLELLVNAPSTLCPHVHAPLQSGSDAVLKRMGRHWYTSASYSAVIDRLAGHMPTLGLGADVITGFPGETEDDHAATIRMVESLPFTYLHVFPYSVRPGTPAERLSGRVQPSIATRRAAELRSLAARKSAEYQLRRAGGSADVVVIGRGAERAGMTGDYLSVQLEPRPFEPGARFVGRLQASPGGGLQAILVE